MKTTRKRIFYVVKLKTGYIEYAERIDAHTTEYGTTTYLSDAKVYFYYEDNPNQQKARLKAIEKNVGYKPKAKQILY